MSDLDDPYALLGAWTLSRVVEDRLAGQESRIDGELVLSAAAPGRIAWHESGLWHRQAGDVEVHRRLWLEDDGSTGWWVRFEDGRDFHPWSPGETVTHPCDPDTYVGLVEGTTDRWTVRWEASGPQKDYTMTSVLVRALSRRGAAGP